VKTENIHRIWAREGHTSGTFEAFTNRQEDLRHAYEKLQRVNAKPEFSVIYEYLSNFLDPFIKAKTIALAWNNSKNDWNDNSRVPLKKNDPAPPEADFPRVPGFEGKTSQKQDTPAPEKKGPQR
jgi:hypothetical protein